MSVLRDIVIFLLCFQLAIQVTNQIEITPGLKLNTGQITPFQTWYDPMNGLIHTTNYTLNAFNSLVPTYCSSNSSCVVTYTVSLLNLINYNWSLNINEHFLILGFDTGFPIGQVMNLLGFLAVMSTAWTNFIWGIGLTILMMIFNITIGAIPFYSNLFSLVDPSLGPFLGICVGGLQMFVVGWELLKIGMILLSALIAMI